MDVDVAADSAALVPDCSTPLLPTGCGESFLSLQVADLSCQRNRRSSRHLVRDCSLIVLTAFVAGLTSGALRSRRTLFMLFTSAYLVAANWFVYVYSTFIGEITQASLATILPL